MVDGPYDLSSLCDGGNEAVLGRRERLDAVDDPGTGGGLGDSGEALRTPLLAVRLLARLQLALRRRAVHENPGAEVGGEAAQLAHDVNGAGALGSIAGRDRQA